MKDEILSSILPYVKNKDVLDVGCIGHDLKRINKNRI
jgi:hypothetical protein